MKNANLSELKEWKELRGGVYSVILNEVLGSNGWGYDVTSNKILGPDFTSRSTSSLDLDYETVGLHYYEPHMMSPEAIYNPPHMDSGMLTILVRGFLGDNAEFDGLEVADLETTGKMGSNEIGMEASFLRVPVNTDEVVVFVGTGMQRLLGKDTARACVHRVRAPTLSCGKTLDQPRVTVALFCAPRK